MTNNERPRFYRRVRSLLQGKRKHNRGLMRADRKTAENSEDIVNKAPPLLENRSQKE